MVWNVHERVIAAPVQEVGRLLEGLGGPADRMWPVPAWPPSVLDRPPTVGAAGGHGPVRYRVTGYDPGRRVEFTFDPRIGLDGTHMFTVEPAGPARCTVRHVIAGRTVGRGRILWPVAFRWLHDALLEDLLDRVEHATATGPARSARWPPWVRLLRRAVGVRARTAAVPDTPLLADALPRTDFADAHAIACGPGMPSDPQVWADAVFRDPPGWVRAALGLREVLVGFVGIARSGTSSFDTIARTADEVLLGTDERHLDFRASVLREPGRVVLTTVVRIHNARGRAYFALVRLVHPVIVRAMLTRAAHRLSRGSDARAATTRA
ncbi:DUF2867 domain-containing protein [Pseudonocardia sp.]|uniref:DUF2867 domain-containing protein n=1 Tax=Pseudonocardia sp. TaxID=60912 RepID=UPI002622AFF6|nr:DUF2867 domain-containing protein [Pseudonocardia sp.]